MFPKILTLVSVYSGIHAISHRYQYVSKNNIKPFTNTFTNKTESNLLLNLIDDLGNITSMIGYGVFGACIGSTILMTAPISLPLIYFYYNPNHKNQSHLTPNKLLIYQ